MVIISRFTQIRVQTPVNDGAVTTPEAQQGSGAAASLGFGSPV